MAQKAGFSNIRARFEQKPPGGFGGTKGVDGQTAVTQKPAIPHKRPTLPNKPGVSPDSKPDVPAKKTVIGTGRGVGPVGAVSLNDLLSARRNLHKSEEDLTSVGIEDANKENIKTVPPKPAKSFPKPAHPLPNAPPVVKPKTSTYGQQKPYNAMKKSPMKIPVMYKGKPLAEEVILKNGKMLKLIPFVAPTTGPPPRPFKPNDLTFPTTGIHHISNITTTIVRFHYTLLSSSTATWLCEKINFCRKNNCKKEEKLDTFKKNYYL